MGKPTIDDVAALAGVGRTTVSRVLNAQPNVRDEVREKVARAVKLLDYKVNVQARNLAGGRAVHVTLVHATDFDSEPNSYFSSAIELGATRAAARLGVELRTTYINQTDPMASSEVIRQVRLERGDGVILTPPFADDLRLIDNLTGAGGQVVSIAGGPGVEEHAFAIGIDDFAAGYEIGRVVADAGHAHIGYIRGLSGHVSAGRRFDGFAKALLESGLSIPEERVARGNFTFKSGAEAAERLLDGDVKLSAIVCANDDMAAGALLTAHKRGLAIPTDIAVVGFDDTPVSQIVWPPLTTVHQPLRRIGERSIERLFEALADDEGEAARGREIIAHTIMPRDSMPVAHAAP